MGYQLARRHRRSSSWRPPTQVGDSWRNRWDSLRLFSPARYDGLPGMPYPGPAWSFPTHQEFADYLVDYAARWELPVRTGVTVRRLWPRRRALRARRRRPAVRGGQRGRRGRVRPAAEGAGVRRRAGPADRPAAPRATTATRRSWPTATCWSSAPATPARTSRWTWRGLTGCCCPAGTPARCPGDIDRWTRAAAHPAGDVRLPARADRPHADGPRDAPAGAGPQRPADPDQVART